MQLHVELIDIVLRLLCATFFGGVIGFERELSKKPAGMRTHILISIGSCLFSLLAVIFYESFPGQMDISRMASQIVVGVGFLGAGTIMRSSEGSAVGGLTTAAAIWVMAAIGSFVGFGYYAIAGIATLIVFIILVIFTPLEKKMAKKFSVFTFK